MIGHRERVAPRTLAAAPREVAGRSGGPPAGSYLLRHEGEEPAHGEVREYFRYRTRLHEVVSLGGQREQYRTHSAAPRAMLEAA